MQLNITTDYAIRTIIYLGQIEGKATANQIAEDMKIPRGYLEKILRKLKNAAYIHSEPGSHGGYYLDKTLSEITLGNIISTMENTVKINRCLECDNFCNQKAEATCAVRKFYVKTQKKLEEEIFNISIADILDEKEWL